MAKNKKVERKKLLTLSDLYNFYACQNENLTFSSTEAGYKLAVQVPAQFEINKEQNDDSLLFCLVKLMHSGENRNHSSVTDDALVKASKGLAYKPILANFVEYTDPDTNETMVDFTSHDMELTEKGVVYYEHQIGCFTADKPYFEVEEDTGHNFLYGYCAIPRKYTEACSIIERKNGTKISVELEVNEMQYSVKDKVLELTDVTIMGATCLGKNPDTLQNVEEGMKNARLDIVDFSVENNSVINYSHTQNDKLIETLEKLNTTLSKFNIDNHDGKEEQFVESNIILEEVVEEVVETTEEPIEEVTEAVVEDNFEETTEESTEEVVAEETSEETTEESTEVTPEVVVEEEVSEETEEVIVQNSINYSVNDKTFAISLDDIQFALNTLVNDTYSEQDGCYYATTIYEDHLVMIDFWTGKAYRQNYKKRKDIYSLTGDRVPVKSCWLSADEEKAIDDMRANYSSISEKLAKYEAEPAKMEVINSESYAKIAETAEFTELKNNHFDLSIEEVSAKADEILLAYAKNGSLNFSVESEKKTVGMTRLPIQTSTNKKSRYGSLKFN